MKTVFITGSGRGIGAACAETFAAGGWRVALHCNTSLAQAKALGERLRGPVFQADLSRPGQADAVVDAAIKELGHLDALVCNAGVSYFGLLQDMDDADWRRVMGVNLDGVFYCCRRAIPHFVRQGGGRIVTVSSMWGRAGASCEAAYSASKAGVIGLTRALAKELGLSGVTVNCVAPGVIDTDMNRRLTEDDRRALAEQTPLGRLGTPEEVAAAVYFLCSSQAGFITGQILGVDGGFV
ncbi:MAG: 3-oxoacyl-ACP reductase FabG [Oscillospiraceae bacterium]|nr:3-oxoacyl-ACP reductase FabG [Oscillospiraceae bacterium]